MISYIVNLYRQEAQTVSVYLELNTARWEKQAETERGQTAISVRYSIHRVKAFVVVTFNTAAGAVDAGDIRSRG